MWRDRLLRALVVLGACLMALTAFLTWRQGQMAAARLGQMVTVWAPARDLPAATLIEPGALTPVQVPAGAVLPGMVTDPDTAAGRISPVPIPAGQPLVHYALLAPDLGESELRRFDVHGSEQGNVVLPAGLQSGDRVDVIVAGESPEGGNEARVRLRDILVLATGSGEAPGVALAVTLEQAEQLTYYLNFAREVRILRRGPVGRAAG